MIDFKVKVGNKTLVSSGVIYALEDEKIEIIFADMILNMYIKNDLNARYDARLTVDKENQKKADLYIYNIDTGGYINYDTTYLAMFEDKKIYFNYNIEKKSTGFKNIFKIEYSWYMED